MSMEHRAFLFDWNSFIKELSNILHSALATDDSTMLIHFIDGNRNILRDPYTGDFLNSDWRNDIEVEDVQQYGNLALTKFYDSVKNIGLGYGWVKLRELLDNAGMDPDMVLGEPFGPEQKYFDPGKMGTYFQSEEQIKKNLQQLNDLIEEKPSLSGQLAELIEMFKRAEQADKRLLITIV